MSKLSEIISKNEPEVRKDWMKNMVGSVRRTDLMNDQELQNQARDLLSGLAEGVRSGETTNLDDPAWSQVRDLMQSISVSRAQQGFTPNETATFVLSLKRPLFNMIRKELGRSPDELFEEIWNANLLLDSLALFTMEAFIAARERLIARQQQELLELSTPVVKLWQDILALPIIGTLDSARTQVVMESLLQTLVETNSRFAIIDITGVPTVDTLVAQHLLKTVTAARLMGAECIISGVRPQIAQTIVHLGIDLTQVTTKARMADALALALQKSGRAVIRTGTSAHSKPGSPGPEESTGEKRLE